MIWPKQNTGKFAPPACATCCASGPPPEMDVEIVRLRYLIDGVEQDPSTSVSFWQETWSLSVTPTARDPDTGIIATGVLLWTNQVFGEVAPCTGCYGTQCLDGEGNPVDGGDLGYSDHSYELEFYVVAPVGPGQATDKQIAYFVSAVGFATNWPACEEGSTEEADVVYTFSW